jgi:hypothetical protein
VPQEELVQEDLEVLEGSAVCQEWAAWEAWEASQIWLPEVDYLEWEE